MIFRGGRLDEATDDAPACEFWLAKAPQLGLDARAASIVGLSAGGTLALLAASRVPELATLTCCFGLYEVDHLRGPATLLPRLLFATTDRAAWLSRSPRHVTQPAMSTLLLHGTDDGLVLSTSAQAGAHRKRWPPDAARHLRRRAPRILQCARARCRGGRARNHCARSASLTAHHCRTAAYRPRPCGPFPRSPSRSRPAPRRPSTQSPRPRPFRRPRRQS